LPMYVQKDINHATSEAQRNYGPDRMSIYFVLDVKIGKSWTSTANACQKEAIMQNRCEVVTVQ